jgi:hypothetical protein
VVAGVRNEQDAAAITAVEPRLVSRLARRWNIAVVLIEVAATDTDMWRDRDDLMDTTIAAMSAEDRELY